MRGFRSLFGSVVVATIATAWVGTSANASVLQSLGTDNVATTYTYPGGESVGGQLTLSDTGLGAIATFIDASQLPLSNVSLTLSIPLLSEGGDPGDTLADGIFGPGVLTLTDGVGPTLFQATLTGFELSEVIPGSYVGSGNFVGAVYGGALSGVTAPTSGNILTSLFSWHTGGFNGPVVDINNFLTAPPGGSTIYSDLHDLNILPEPGTLAMLSMAVFGLLRRHRA